MQLKGKKRREKCPFCFRDNLWTEVELKCGRTRRTCKCGYTWLKETWLEMLTRRGRVWAGHKYDSDYLEEQILDQIKNGEIDD